MSMIDDPFIENPIVASVDLLVVGGGMTGIAAGRLDDDEEGVSVAEPIPHKE
jgi:glycerol-3-phosphate dehydrogenase